MAVVDINICGSYYNYISVFELFMCAELQCRQLWALVRQKKGAYSSVQLDTGVQFLYVHCCQGKLKVAL
jgi:hypothetical protein